jgi:hypothetical protein
MLQFRIKWLRWSESAAGSFGEGIAMLQFRIKWLRRAAEMPRFAQRGRYTP